MNPVILVFITATIVFLTGCANGENTQKTLLPGLTYYGGSEQLSGDLVFLYSHGDRNSIDNNNDKCASLYEFDFEAKELIRLTNCPDGQLVAASADALCVIYWDGVYRQESCTNALIYSTKTHLSRHVNLDAVPSLACIVDGHVYFELEGHDVKLPSCYLTTNGVSSEKEIVGYNMAKDALRTVELPGASKWKQIEYDGIHRALGQTNILHFHYGTVGDRLTEGRDYPEGTYSLDVYNGDAHFVSANCNDDERYLLTAYNGRKIAFRDGQSPMDGLELVSVEENVPLEAPKNILLHSFSNSFDSKQDVVVLHGLSPDRHYALVMKMHATESSASGYIYTYYLVDVVGGKTRVLLEDATGVKSKNTIKPSIFWVR